MWLLRSSSAKKINKPFDHKGPIHSVSPSASLFLSFSPSPLHLSLLVSPRSSPFFFNRLPFMWVSSLSFLSLYLIFKCILQLWRKRQRSGREAGIIRPAGGQTHRQAQRQRHRQGAPYSTNTVVVQSGGAQHGKCLHHSVFGTKTRGGDSGENFSPSGHFFAVTNTPAASSRLDNRACVRVFSYAYRWSWCENRPPFPITVLLL